jgi:hypothetical protein
MGRLPSHDTQYTRYQPFAEGDWVRHEGAAVKVRRVETGVGWRQTAVYLGGKRGWVPLRQVAPLTLDEVRMRRYLRLVPDYVRGIDERAARLGAQWSVIGEQLSLFSEIAEGSETM